MTTDPTRHQIMLMADEVGIADHDAAARLVRLTLAAFCSAAPPAPEAGEAGELVAWLRRRAAEAQFDSCTTIFNFHLLTRAADLLEQLEDLAADAVSGLQYIEQTHGRLYGVGWDRVYEKADRLQAVHALPLPAEVE